MGFPVPKNVIQASKQLCISVLSHSGGQSAIANSLGWGRQYFFKCQKKGYVPLSQVYDVSRLLEVSEWALCYYKLKEVFGEKSPTLESVIDHTDILTEDKERILDILHGHQRT